MLIVCMTIFVFLTGCVSRSVRRYQRISNDIQLGSRIDETLPILIETKRGLPSREDKEDVRYIDDEGNEIYIFFARSSNQRLDDLPILDIEFTPIIFYNSVLVAMGWESLDRAMHMQRPLLMDQ